MSHAGSSKKRRPHPPWWAFYKTELLIGLAGLVAIHLIFISTAFRRSTTVDGIAAGQFGDFIGGYVGTGFLLANIILLLTTLRSQQNSQRQTNFDSKYFTLLELHRANVQELQLGESSGRKVFVLMLRELRAILPVVRRVAAASDQSLTSRQALHVAYYCLFFGTGPNSSRMLKSSLTGFSEGFVDALERELDREETKVTAGAVRKLGYMPFEGHQSRLGHYYRHLFQTVGYIDQQTIDIDRYEYAKTIRAQLSTHEQALLLINSLTPLGRVWWDKGYILDYEMAKNLPRYFFDSDELDISSLFPQGYFEWEESSDHQATQ